MRLKIRYDEKSWKNLKAKQGLMHKLIEKIAALCTGMHGIKLGASGDSVKVPNTSLV